MARKSPTKAQLEEKIAQLEAALQKIADVTNRPTTPGDDRAQDAWYRIGEIRYFAEQALGKPWKPPGEDEL